MRVGVVVIGRNEGERLRRCLGSLRHDSGPVVYVDSGSTDGSVSLARALGCDVVELDLTTPFTAARARNAGRARLREIDPALDAIQVVDGDCELNPDWLLRATETLRAEPRTAVVWGRRRERDPERSVYNLLCDLEWDTPVGIATWFGGDALIRASAYDSVNGYDPAVIAGEEPDLAWRLRQRGWVIRRIDAEMTLHDADMTRLSQWWRRAERAGHAHIDMASRHGLGVTPYSPIGVIKNIMWSIGVPAFLIASAVIWSPWVLLGFGIYDLLMLKVTIGARRAGRSWHHALVLGVFTVLAKWPESIGYARWALRRLTRREATIIEYKRPGPSGPARSEPMSSDAR